jgi:hypothetical protein
MAAAGAGGGGGENIHNVIATAPSPLPANVMARIASFVPNWRKIPEFNAFKSKIFHQTPFEIVEQIKRGNQVMLMAYLDYLNSPEFHAARARYAPERPAEDRQILLNDLLGDVVEMAPFESLKLVVEAGADINQRLGAMSYGRPVTLIVRAKKFRRDARDGLKKLEYLIGLGADTHVYDSLDHEYLIDMTLYGPLYGELALIVNSGTNITRLAGNLMYAPNMPFYLTGILTALLIRNDVVNDEILAQLRAVPPEAMQQALARLAQLVHIGYVPLDVAEHAANHAFQNFRQLIVGVLGKDEAVKAVVAIMKAVSMRRRSALVSGALMGGVRKKMGATRKRRHTKRRYRRDSYRR